MKSRLGSGALLLSMFALLAALLAGPAAAHSAATGSNPEDGANLDASPGTVSVTFNEDIKPDFAVLKVVGPDGRFWQQGEPTVEGPVVSVPVNELGPVGEYKINFRVTSADGHPIQGQRTFTLTVAGDGQPGEVADAAEVEGPEESSGINAWWFIAPALVIVAIAAVFAVLRSRRGSSQA